MVFLRLDSDADKAEYRTMQTLSPTKARSNLTFWLKAAACGEDVGILFGDQIIALRPVSVESTDYALREYEVKGGRNYLLTYLPVSRVSFTHSHIWPTQYISQCGIVFFCL